jgi:hypothetical protein
VYRIECVPILFGAERLRARLHAIVDVIEEARGKATNVS